MSRIVIWILISLVIGLVAGFLSMALSGHKTASKTGNALHDESSSVDGPVGKRWILLATVVGVMAFLLVWIVLAIVDRGLL